MQRTQNSRRRDDRPCCRWTLSLLHIFTCFVAGFCILSVLIMRGREAKCLPPITDQNGKVLHYTDAILNAFCDLVLYACGVLSVWNIVSLFIHCCTENKLWIVLQTVIFITISVLGLAGSASVTTQFLMWCRNLQTTYPNATELAPGPSVSCAWCSRSSTSASCVSPGSDTTTTEHVSSLSRTTKRNSLLLYPVKPHPTHETIPPTVIELVLMFVRQHQLSTCI
ncbi:uncharacterized protein LOC124136921 isoform X2 [Haliotis rufescens]|uniref:uncharacterized protein LOC124136921 isoform X2 n=1 Tax=Haliotis rufescens TaxID=6454 RepID=UPI001EAFC7D4|nr:uncharacterized protein LOC124136921 isoform X2 [Haliotis rufescens]